MKRNPAWKQKTPRLQAIALLASAQDDIDNVLMGAAFNNAQVLKRALVRLEQVRGILREMTEGCAFWDDSSQKKIEALEEELRISKRYIKCYSDLDR